MVVLASHHFFIIAQAERNRLYEDWDTRTMSHSLASMSNASSYTFDLKESLKEAALGGLKLNTENPSTEAHSRVQIQYSVKRGGSFGALPALSGSTKQLPLESSAKVMKPWENLSVPRQTGGLSSTVAQVKATEPEVTKSYSLPALQPASKTMAKSKSGPALLVAKFANNVNSFKGQKSRGTDGGSVVSSGSRATSSSVPVAEQAAEDVQGDLALARLIGLRARRQEVRQFLQSCSKSLHRGPWCRVKPRYTFPLFLRSSHLLFSSSASAFSDSKIAAV